MQYKIIIRKAPNGFYIAGCPLINDSLSTNYLSILFFEK
jgi:hypothetical protein